MSRRVRPDDEDPAAPFDLRLVVFAAAVALGSMCGLILPLSAALLGVGAVGLLLLLALRGRRRWGGLVLVAGLVVGTTVAALRFASAAGDPLVAAAGEHRWLSAQAVVDGPPTPVVDSFATSDPSGAPASAQRWRLHLSPELVEVAGRMWRPIVQLTVFSAEPGWGSLIPGSRVRLSGVLRPDARSVLPAAVVEARGPPAVIRAAPWWQVVADRLRQGLKTSGSALDDDARGLLVGLVVGDTSGISARLAADAKATGLTHLLAVSGSHFALICGVVLLVLRRAGPRAAAVVALLASVALVTVVGPSPSVLRAAVMGGIALVGLVLGRPGAALPVLAAAGSLLLLTDPTLIDNAGFGLSVVATAALIIWAPLWSKALQRRGWPRGWAEVVAVPTAASLASLPIVVALSGSVSLASIPANLVAAPAVAPALLLGVLAMVLSPWWPAGATAVANVSEPFLDWIAGTAHRMASWAESSIPWPATLPGVLLLTGLLLAAVLVLRFGRVRAVALAAAVGATVVMLPSHVVALGWPPPHWLLVACEVGQGDGMVLSTGQPGVGVVYDAGPDPALMSDCLDRLGITTVPLVVLSHLHSDHVDGLSGVLAGRSVGAIGVGPDRVPADAWRDVNQAAAERRIPLADLRPGTQWASGRLSLTVLAPSHVFVGTDSDPNNDSVVALVTVDGIRILMTGDIETEAQQELLNAETDLDADVLEQPHHGSAKLLPAFMTAVSPLVSLIGVGLGNDYGQPSPMALDILNRNGVSVLRTDLDGDSAVCLIDGQLQTVRRGAVLSPSKSGPRGGA